MCSLLDPSPAGASGEMLIFESFRGILSEVVLVRECSFYQLTLLSVILTPPLQLCASEISNLVAVGLLTKISGGVVCYGVSPFAYHLFLVQSAHVLLGKLWFVLTYGLFFCSMVSFSVRSVIL